MSKIRIPRIVSLLFFASVVTAALDFAGIFGSSYLSEISWRQLLFLTTFLMVCAWIGWYQEDNPGSDVVAHGLYVGVIATICGTIFRIAIRLSVGELSAEYGQYLGALELFGTFEPWYVLLLFLWVPGVLVGGVVEYTSRDGWITLTPLVTAGFPFLPVTWVVGSVIEISTMNVWVWRSVYIDGEGIIIPVLVGIISMYIAVLIVESMRHEELPEQTDEYEPLRDRRLDDY